MKKLLVLVALIGLGAVVGAIVVGTSTFDGTVVENPYEKGLAWDREQHDRESSGWSVNVNPPTLSVGRDRLYLAVTDKAGKPLSCDVTLIVSRPSSKTYDRTYRTDRSDTGVYTAVVEFPLYGHWDIGIQITAQTKTVTFRKAVYVRQGA